MIRIYKIETDRSLVHQGKIWSPKGVRDCRILLYISKYLQDTFCNEITIKKIDQSTLLINRAGIDSIKTKKVSSGNTISLTIDYEDMIGEYEYEIEGDDLYLYKIL